MDRLNKMDVSSPENGISLWKKIFIGMLIGIVVGVFAGPDAVLLKPIGDLFLNAIKMLIIPLVFCSLVVGVTAISDTQKMGRIAAKSVGIYLLTTALAISIGLMASLLVSPGTGLEMSLSAAQETAKSQPSFIDTLINLVPKNPISALASGNILQTIFFAIGLGIALSLSGEKAKPAIRVFEGLAEAMYKLTTIVMSFAPYGIFALIAVVAGQYGLDILLPLIKVIFLVYLCCIIQVLVVYSGILKLAGRLSPIQYLKALANPAAVAFTTTSSSGTLPVTIRTAHEELGVSREISSFVLPLGATINMDGTAIYQGVAAIFIAQVFGVNLEMQDYLMIIMTSTLASIGTAGVPGAGLIMLSLVLSTVGLPLEGLAIVAGIDRILDMARTSVNVCGDLMVSVLISRSEKGLDTSVYNN
ncbi:Proton/sodium-glutamate symport protein [Vibrio nigripulchritudo SO65]|uniref:dicarboxylate/amino acid:cation symporter n=1 Tax=Vibrio nigripulchritudo TaxID=28173 RepID=UPI0003B2010D|nr:dicarboxylate/amino acid:cation symporter [Vibrio nigripulchritudo]CCN33932.1 Proton/sodium-glutamate symport protein [Vibrio nigripulchritudo AM115]CCN43750.1 Proton/sodium-glutamate symport protein [Vibrio nigripulchritudo FTn2]CCN65212.1 Proton/sodium-glutamate symport protein [Vibrio nigripulchritudo POn4]CCN79016.1 Proton/sodium-glutamate symport protein [Vibrio nigripulchritudo SO65]